MKREIGWIVGALLASGLLGGEAWAHVGVDTLPSVSCISLPTAENFFTPTDIRVPLSGDIPNEGTVSVTAGNSNADKSGKTGLLYARLTLPPLSAGNLTITSTDMPADAVLCRGSTQVVKAATTYPSAHRDADTDANDAAGASLPATELTESQAKSLLRTVKSELARVKTALENAGSDVAAAGIETLLGDADITGSIDAARQADPFNLDDARSRLGEAATALRNVYGAGDSSYTGPTLDTHKNFTLRTRISAGINDYTIVVAAEPSVTAANLNLTFTFNGIMETTVKELDDVLEGRNGTAIRRLKMTPNTTGLLKVRTTGSVWTEGTLDNVTGSTISATFVARQKNASGPFDLVTPVKVESPGPDYRLYIRSPGHQQGSFSLQMDMYPASETPLVVNGTQVDGMLEKDRGDYHFFSRTDTDGTGWITVSSSAPKNAGIALYSQRGLVASRAAAKSTKLSGPIAEGDYIVEVTGPEGAYMLTAAIVTAQDRGTAPDGIAGPPDTNPTLNPGDIQYHAIDIKQAGTLNVKTTESTDTFGILYGPGGQMLAQDDNSGPGLNFQIVKQVSPGRHVVSVQGKELDTTGAYKLEISFIEGVTIDETGDTDTDTDTDTGTGTGTTDDDEDIIPDPVGLLGVPGHGDSLSGILLIRGWVCQDDGNGVRIEIRDADGDRAVTPDFIAPYGSRRTDVTDEGHCAEKADHGYGFSGAFNLNSLADGFYTFRAFVGRQPIGLADDEGEIQPQQAHRVEVVRISDEEFLRGVQSEDIQVEIVRASNEEFRETGQRNHIRVEDFPEPGTNVILRWHQGSQNFQIVDAE